MENNNELKIITDETLMEKRNHGQPAFPFQYYLEDIWDFDFHTLGWHWHQEIEFVYVQSGEAYCCVGKDRFLCQQAAAYLSIRKYCINLQQSTPP